MRASRQLTGLLTLALSCSCLAQGKSVELVKNGTSRHQIVLQPGASASERFGAEELQTHIKACTGVELPIVETPPGPDVPMILLGCGDLAKKLGVDPTPDQLGPQGFLLRTVPPHVVIAGTKAAGTMYGTQRFLESCLGVRWFAPGVTRTPKTSDVTVPPVDRLVKPAMMMRSISYACPGANAEFWVHQGYNRLKRPADDRLGIGYQTGGACHSYFHFVSPGEFFETHPEYFSEIGGKRFGTETQLCLTNPEVLEIVTKRMLAEMEKDKERYQFNFSQMDYYNYCECPKCRAINEKYATTGGTQYWFVNKLAERTSKVFPDKLISTLAYTYTEEPPKNMKMHPNVAVWLCHMFPCCDSHPIATCPRNADYKRRATAWSQLCSHLYIWHYIVDFAHYYNPFPNFRSMAADMKFYRDIGVEGIYLQGMGHDGGGGEFSLLRPYLGMKLIWDPDQDAEAIIRDFLDGYYGPAAKPIYDYITMIHDKVQKDDLHMHLYTNPAMGYLPDEIMAKAMTLFDQAEAAVKDDPELLERVKVARMPLTYARLFPRNGYKIEDGKLSWLGDIASQQDAVRFIQRMKKHGFRTIREWGGDPQQMTFFGSLLNSRLNVETIQNDHLAVEVVPILAGRVLRITDRKTGKCLTAYNNKRVLFFPFCGGLESRIGETFRFSGWMEPGAVVSQSDTSVTVSLMTGDGFRLKRTLTLADGKPLLEVTTVATNPDPKSAGEGGAMAIGPMVWAKPSGKPREIRLRSHLELDLGELRKTRVRFTDRAGKNVDKDLTQVITGLREGEHLYREDCPAAALTLSGTKGLQLTQTFDADPVDFAWLYAYPEDLDQLDVEIWLKRKTLAPGESLTFKETIEVRPTPP
ncbi:MAG: DUF4838 domain-containing protein [Phycisphaerae bacterium]|nr:DUF4838 domain-containing protein [Phycisphaerae bacterium]